MLDLIVSQGPSGNCVIQNTVAYTDLQLGRGSMAKLDHNGSSWSDKRHTVRVVANGQ